MRRLIGFASKGNALVGTLDLPDTGKAKVGVLIVSGGNEPRFGAHRGMALLAQSLAQAGIAAFRFDRSGTGDSTGTNVGFAGSNHDVFNAALVFGNETGIDALLGFGNCDAASALALFGKASGVSAVVLANPWLVEEQDELPPAAAIRARYAERLRDPTAWFRLARGKVDVHKLIAGLSKLRRAKDAAPAALATRVLAGVAEWGANATVVLASGDATALAFSEAAEGAKLSAKVLRIDTASHSFAGPVASTALFEIIRDAANTLALQWED